MTLRELIEQIVKHLVDQPDKVSVKEITGERTTVYELKVDKADLGKVIGRDGRTARALRTIITASSMKAGKRAMLEIIE